MCEVFDCLRLCVCECGVGVFGSFWIVRFSDCRFDILSCGFSELGNA